MKTWSAIAVGVLSGSAVAQESVPEALDPLATETLGRVFGSLALVLVGIFALMWLLRRSSNLVRGRGGRMQVLDVLSLGQRERLVLVSVGDKQLLLGVSPGRVQAVHTLDQPASLSVDEPPKDTFAEALRRVSGRHETSEHNSRG